MTKRTPDEYTRLRELHMLMQPTRIEVLIALLETNESLYIKEIADRIHAQPRNVSFHLARLAALGIVKGEYKPIETESGKPGKFYTLNPDKKNRVKELIKLAS